MYRTIVAAQVRKAWRHIKEAMDRWFQRVFTLVGDCRFEVQDVLVKGWPWRTRTVVLLRVTGRLAGEPHSNDVVQTIDIRWGRITAVTTLEDTQKLERLLDRLAATRIEEAHAPPIEDGAVSRVTS